MRVHVVIRREKIRSTAQLEQYKQLAPASLQQHSVIFRARHSVMKSSKGRNRGHRERRRGRTVVQDFQRVCDLSHRPGRQGAGIVGRRHSAVAGGTSRTF
jgi:hypothetical protein